MPWYKNPEIWVPFAIFAASCMGVAVRFLLRRHGHLLAEKKPEFAVVAMQQSQGPAVRIEKSSVSGSNFAVGENVQQIIHNHAAITPVPKNEADFPQTKPSPQEISEYIERLTPYEQRGKITAYDGVEVSWLCTFSDVEVQGDAFRTYFGWDTDAFFKPGHTRSNDQMRIICGIRIQEVPRFKTLQRGSRVGIKGRISHVGRKAVRLEKPQFTFFDAEL